VEPLSDEYLADCRKRAHAVGVGSWAGTFGSLGASVIHLLAEVDRLKQLLAEHQAEREERYRPYWSQPHD